METADGADEELCAVVAAAEGAGVERAVDAFGVAAGGAPAGGGGVGCGLVGG